MARVKYLDKEDLAEGDQELLTRGISLHRALVNSPDGTRAFSTMAKWIRHESKFDPRLRELAILQVGWLAKAEYEWSHHVKIGRDFGVSDDDIRALMAESAGADSGLPALDKAVLRAAREMANDGAMSAATFAELAETFDDGLMVELTLMIGFYCAVVRVLPTLQIDVEDSYAHYLDEFPLPK
jgi:alkylhydroperoxidase family enzyme